MQQKLITASDVRRAIRTLVFLCSVLLPALHASFAAGQVRKVLVLGDSLSAGFGLPETSAFPAQLEQALRESGRQVTVINAGVSGDTAGAGLARLDWVLSDDIDAVIVELGANDMLRGLDPAETERALDSILSSLKEKKKRILLAGMLAAPGMSKQYEERFNAIFPRLAEKFGVSLYPFFLDGVITRREYLLNDGMHPNREGIQHVVRAILPYVVKLIDEPARP